MPHPHKPIRRLLALAALTLMVGGPMAGVAQPLQRDATEAGDRIILKFRDVAGDFDATANDARIRALRGKNGIAMDRLRTITRDLHVVRLDRTRPAAELNALLATLRANPQVEFAEPDRRVHAHAYTPNDPLFASQWFLQSTQPAAVRAHEAWDVSKGGSSASASTVVVAVLDSGVRFDHPDLRRASAGGKLLPGFDFVSADSAGVFATANDGDGWDADPSDPGDWLSAGDLASAPFRGRQCGGGANKDQPTASSWHGTRVAGLIAADTDNGIGIAGAGFNLRILPVRVLGKCGGFDSDVIAAMYWSAGLSIPPPLVTGIPIVNPNPAQVINMSLGGIGACSATYATAVRDVTAKGVLIVASAGNEGGAVDEPANCSGVLAVAGVRHVGTKVGYSNLGTEVGIAAPAGNCVNTAPGTPCLFPLHTTTDLGTQGPAGPAYSDANNATVGTSFAAPLVAAAAGLMQSTNPGLTMAQLVGRMKASARPFPTTSDTTPTPPACHVPTGSGDVQDLECLCTTASCGAGMLDMGAALREAQRPIAVAGSSGTVGNGKTLTLDGGSSTAAAGRTIASHAWSVVGTTGGATTPVPANPSAATTTVMSPTTGSYTLRLTVTDNIGAADTADITIQAASAGGGVTSTSPPAGPGGGGGTLGLELLVLAALAALRRRAPGPAAFTHNRRCAIPPGVPAAWT
ncbi:MAG: hypothetical protein RLZZ393_1360 [Pseudomonadota bacterium]|jgi:serine protease